MITSFLFSPWEQQYRRDMGPSLYDQVIREIEDELPKEKQKKSRKGKCGHSFAVCKFKSACKYAHQDIFNDVKILFEMLKEARNKAPSQKGVKPKFMARD